MAMTDPVAAGAPEHLVWRPARPADAFLLMDLADQAGYALDHRWIRGRLGADPAAETHLVAALDGLPVAAAHLHLLPPPPGSTAHRARLSALVVDEVHRGRGLGSALLSWCESAARDRGASALEILLPATRPQDSGFWSHRGYTQPEPGCRLKSLTGGPDPATGDGG